MSYGWAAVEKEIRKRDGDGAIDVKIKYPPQSSGVLKISP
jgi:hypothetical protein